MKLTARYLQITQNQPTVHNRVYSKKVLEQIIQASNERSRNNRNIGYLEKPEYPGGLRNATFLVQRMYLQDGRLVADLELLKTPNGHILEQLVTLYPDSPNLAFTIGGNGKVTTPNRLFKYLQWLPVIGYRFYPQVYEYEFSYVYAFHKED